MENNFFVEYLNQTLAGLTVGVLLAIGGMIFAYLKSKRFREFVKQLIGYFRKLAFWFVKNVKVFIWILFLFILEIIIWAFYLDWRLIVISLVHLAFIISGFYILFRQYSESELIKTKHREKFCSIPIPSGIGNKYFHMYYVDAPTGEITLGGVDFTLTEKTLVFDTGSQIRNYIQRDDGSKEVRFKLTEPKRGITAIYMLINSGNTTNSCLSKTIGELSFNFVDSPPLNVKLILGKNIREWLIGTPGDVVREASDPNLTKVWQGVNKEGIYAVIDCLKIEAPKSLKGNELQEIVFIHNNLETYGVPLNPQYFISGISLELDI